MKCIYCNEDNLDDSTFCMKCGKKIENKTIIKKDNFISKLKKVNKKVWLFLVIIIIGIIFIFFIKGKKNKIKNEEDVYNEKFVITKSETFFLKDSDTEGYALFSSSGKRLTDYIYKTDKTTFYNHATTVETLDGKKCAINDSGKTIIKCGEYSDLTRIKATFKASKDDKTFLINSNGKTIKSFVGYVDIDSYGEYDEFILVSNDEKYYVIDFEGDIIFTFDKLKDVNPPTVNYTNGIISYFYNGESHILDIKKNNQIISIKDKNHLCVNSTDQKGNIIVLQSCSSWYNSIDEKRYVILDKGKITFDSASDNSCESISYYQNTLRCYKENMISFIEPNGNKINEANVRDIGYTEVKDYVENKSGEVIFYKNNKAVNTVKGTLQNTGYSKEAKYILSVDGGYELYNSNGKPVINEKFKKIYSYYGSYYYAKVDENNFVFILDNKKSDSYYSVGNNVDKYYYVETKKDVHNIVDSTTGKTKLLDSEVAYKILTKGDIIIAYVYNEGETKMYNLQNGKEFITLKGEVKFLDYYFTYSNDEVIEYYSYKTGDKFLERKKS